MYIREYTNTPYIGLTHGPKTRPSKKKQEDEEE